MTDYYEYTATGNRAIRTGPGATYSRIVSNSDFLTDTIAKGNATEADRKTLTDTEAAAVQGWAGDVWVKLYDNNGKAVNGWTAKIHKGAPQVTEKLITVTPPPTSLPDLPFSFTIGDDVTYVKQTINGVLKAKV